MSGSDPRRPSEVVKAPKPKDDDITGGAGFLGTAATAMNMVGMFSKNKWAAWLGLILSVLALTQSQSGSRMQAVASLVMSLVAVSSMLFAAPAALPGAPSEPATDEEL